MGIESFIRDQINNDESNFLSKEITFNIQSNRWEGEFRAPTKGQYNFQIFMNSNEVPIQKGNFKVVESQIELSNVYLNEKLLQSLSTKSKGNYYNWNERGVLFNSISKSRNLMKLLRKNIKINYFYLLFCYFLLSTSSRRNKGLVTIKLI